MNIKHIMSTLRSADGSIWNRCRLLFPLQRSFVPQDYIISDGSTKATFKRMCAIVKDKPEQESLFAYLSSISGLPLYLHESEFRYGEGEYNRGSDDQTLIVIVPSNQLYQLPWYLRRSGWKYISITCKIEDDRFDIFTIYESIPAIKYRI